MASKLISDKSFQALVEDAAHACNEILLTTAEATAAAGGTGSDVLDALGSILAHLVFVVSDAAAPVPSSIIQEYVAHGLLRAEELHPAKAIPATARVMTTSEAAGGKGTLH